MHQVCSQLTHLDGSGVPTGLLDLVFSNVPELSTPMRVLCHQSVRTTIYQLPSLAPHQRKPTPVVSEHAKWYISQEIFWQNGQFLILLRWLRTCFLSRKMTSIRYRAGENGNSLKNPAVPHSAYRREKPPRCHESLQSLTSLVYEWHTRACPI